MAPRFKTYSPAERKAVLRRYRKALAAGKPPTAAARKAGASIEALRRWIEEETAPVAIVRDRACLGCGNTFRSDGPHRRLCDRCSARIAALPRAWSA